MIHHISADITGDEYLDSDSNLCAYLTIDLEQTPSDKWREDLRDQALALYRNEDPCDEAESDEDEILEIEEETVITTTKQAIKCAEDMQRYFTATDNKGSMMTMGRIVCHLQDKLWKETKATKQSTLLEYFEHY